MTTVFLLEDDEDLQTEIASCLTGHGYAIQTAKSLTAFRQLCASQTPELVVMDRHLPDGDSMALIAEVHARHAPCGVVMFSAQFSPQDRIQGLRAGADHYLPKPLPLKELLAVLRSLERRMALWPR